MDNPAARLGAAQALKAFNPELAVLTGHTSEVKSVAFSPDGRTLASVSDDQTNDGKIILLWNLENGKKTRKREDNTISSIVFSPNGKWLEAAIGDDIKIQPYRSGDLEPFIREIKAYGELGSSVRLDENDNPIPADILALTKARYEAALNKGLPWRADGGAGLAEFYLNSLSAMWWRPTQKGLSLEVLKLLLTKNLIRPKEKSGEYALIQAAASGLSDCLAYLLDIGVHIEVRSVDGRTVLMYASGYGRIDIVKYLLERGADLKAKNKAGQTAGDLACGREKREYILRLLTGNPQSRCP